MENSEIQIVFIGTPEFGAKILKGLTHRPVLVITVPDKPVGRKKILTPSPVKKQAELFNIPVEYDLNKIKDVDLIITAAYGKIIPKDILDIPKYGAINIHPSLLPKHRGPSPIQITILNGDKSTGVSIMLMDEEIDHGPIISSIEFPINKDYTYSELDSTLAEEAVKLLINTIPKWINKDIQARPQDHSKATYTKIIKKEDGEIDWKKTPQEIERQIRAFNPWPGTFTIWKGKTIKILEAEVIKDKLVIKKVQPEGKKPMTFEDFLRGHKDFNIK